jgi:hypothetical protein
MTKGLWLQQRFALVRGPGGNLVQSAAVNTRLSIPTEQRFEAEGEGIG